jgi:hypothetical protein
VRDGDFATVMPMATALKYPPLRSKPLNERQPLFYKGECQEKYFPLDGKLRKVFLTSSPLCDDEDAWFWAALKTVVL